MASEDVSALLLRQVLVACLTVFGGLMAFNYHRTLQVWAVPLLLAAALAYLVAHSFLSVFEAVLGTLLLCLAADLHTNDGSPGKPYFMDHELLVSTHRASGTICTLMAWEPRPPPGTGSLRLLCLGRGVGVL